MREQHVARRNAQLREQRFAVGPQRVCEPSYKQMSTSKDYEEMARKLPHVCSCTTDLLSQEPTPSPSDVPSPVANPAA
jgi:hypothetical protein